MANKLSPSDNDYITNKILLVFAYALVMCLLLVLAQKTMSTVGSFQASRVVVRIVGWTALAGTAVCLFFHLKNRHKETTRKVVTALTGTVALAVVALCCMLMLVMDFNYVIKVLYIIIPGSAVLYLIFMLFQKEFFLIAAYSAVATVYFWQLSHLWKGGSTFYIAQALCLILTLAAAVVLRRIEKNGGVLKLGRHKIQIVSNDSGCGWMYFTFTLAVVMSIVAFFIPSSVIVYFSFVMLAYVFAAAVFYTVKMM